MSCSLKRSVFTSFVALEVEANFDLLLDGSGVLSEDCGIDGSRKGAIGTGTGGGGGEGSWSGSR
jgi:hypothetical protein